MSHWGYDFGSVLDKQHSILIWASSLFFIMIANVSLRLWFWNTILSWKNKSIPDKLAEIDYLHDHFDKLNFLKYY